MNQQYRLYARLFLLCSVIGLTALLNVFVLPGEMAAPAFAACTGKLIVFVPKSLNLLARDLRLIEYLQASGHRVAIHTSREVLPEHTIGQDLVIISESADSFDIEDRLNEIPAPILTWEGWLQDNLGMTGPTQFVNYGEVLRATQIEIVDSTHPLAAGLTGVVTTIATVNDRFHWGQPNGNAAVVATMPGNSNRVTIYAYEQGAQMFNRVAPAKRIFIHNATGNNLTAEGWAIFRAAVDWAMNCTVETATPTATPSSTPTATPTSTSTSTSTEAATPIPNATNTPIINPTASQTATAAPTSSATPTNSATSTPLPPSIVSVSKTDLLFIDADSDERVSAGDTLIYTIRIRNSGGRSATNIELEDTPDANTTLVIGSVQTERGVIRQGNNPNDRQAIVQVDTLSSGAVVQINLQVRVKQNISGPDIRNQAIVRYHDSADQPGGQSVTVSDDPDTAQPMDTTVTPLGSQPTGRQIFLPFMAKQR